MMNYTRWQNLAQTEKTEYRNTLGFFILITVLMLQKTFDTAAVLFYMADSLLLTVSILNLLKNPKILKAPQQFFN